MPIRVKEKINVKRQNIRKIDPKIEMDIKNIDKVFKVPEVKISRPLDLSKILSTIKSGFKNYIVPYLTGEYKNTKPRKEVIQDTTKIIRLRQNLIQMSEHFKDFIFQMKMYLISKAVNSKEYKDLEKEIKEWEKIVGKVLDDFIENITFVIQNNLVPVCEKIQKDILREGGN
jgi:hypothetical protein